MICSLRYRLVPILLLVLGGVLCRDASALIGETLPQSIASYGQPLSVAGNQAVFTKNGSTLTVTFTGGVTTGMHFRTKPSASLSDFDVRMILRNNSRGTTWLDAGDSAWKSSDGSMTASLPDRHDLIIRTIGTAK